MKSIAALLLGIAALAAQPLSAATRTVTLSVPGMDCALCPITIKTALGNVNGVIKTEASLEKHEAVVTFDDARTNVDVLTNATARAGYPATVKK